MTAHTRRVWAQMSLAACNSVAGARARSWREGVRLKKVHGAGGHLVEVKGRLQVHWDTVGVTLGVTRIQLRFGASLDAPARNAR